jgi:ubiquinol oxidase
MTAPFIDLSVHHRPKGVSDRIAFGFTKLLRWTADTFFAERYGHRAVVLETVAAVPGMVGATINHLLSAAPHVRRQGVDQDAYGRSRE